MNDSFIRTLTLLFLAILSFPFLHAQTGPPTVGDTICLGDSGVVKVMPTAPGTTYSWYDAATGGNLIGTGDSLVLAPSTTTTYYVSGMDSNANTFNVGPTDNTIAGGTNYTFYPDGLVLSVTNTVQIDTVFVYPNGPGNVVINLTNTGNTVLQSAAIQVNSTGKTAVPLGFCITPGTYRLNANGTTTGGLFRNTGGAQYPYTNGPISITGAINTSTTFYYFFYDWKVSAPCGAIVSPRSPATITVNPIPNVDITGDTLFCTGDSTLLTVTGTGSTCIWSDGSTQPVLAVGSGGTYSVICTDGNVCSGEDSIEVSEVILPSPGAPDTVSLCSGTVTQICANASPGAAYNWSNGSIGACTLVNTPGIYEVDCIDSVSGCSVRDTSVVVLSPSPVAIFVVDTNNCPDIEFIAQTGDSTWTYAWDYGDSTLGSGPISNHVYSGNGSYQVTLTVDNGCLQDTAALTVDVSCLVAVDNPLPRGWKVYPNPSAGRIFIEAPAGTDTYRVELVDLNGRVLASRSVDGQTQGQELQADLPNGIYLLRIRKGSGNSSHRIIISK